MHSKNNNKLATLETSPMILGLGHAITDQLFQIKDSFLEELSLVKGTMTLVDSQQIKSIETKLKNHNYQEKALYPAGSIANTITTLSKLDYQTNFITNIGNDDFGKIYLESIKQNKITLYCKFITNNQKQHTARSIILLTPDSERTMLTHLGCSSLIDLSNHDIMNHIESIQTPLNNAYFLLEGYILDSIDIKTLVKFLDLLKQANYKIILTLSDYNLIKRHKKVLLDLIEHYVEFIFGNNIEIATLLDKNCNIDEPIIDLDQAQILAQESYNFINKMGSSKIFIMTLNQNGAMAITEQEIFYQPSQENIEIIDSTGAGDIFLAGFLHGFLTENDLNYALKIGNYFASNVIQQLGTNLKL